MSSRTAKERIQDILNAITATTNKFMNPSIFFKT